MQTRFEFVKYFTLIGPFHPSKKWVLREKCVLKSRFHYSDKECKKLRCGERSSHRERTHHAAVEMDGKCPIFSSTNSSIHHGLILSGSAVKCTVQALSPNL